MDRAARRRAWRSFRGAPPATRAFLAARLAVLPLRALDAELRALHGHVLSLGSGHGVLERYLAEINPAVMVEGIELDGERVRVASATADAAPRVSIREGDVRELDAGGYDAALAVDVLHHVPAGEHAGVAAALGRALRPGGVCVVKDIGVAPRWKYAWNRLHDRVVAGPEPLHCRTPDEMAAVFEAAGFDVRRVESIDRGSPYPHYLVALVRSGDAR